MAACPNPEYLTVEDLKLIAGADVVTRLFDDVGNGIVDEDIANVIMTQAEAIAASRMLRAYSADQMRDLGQNDFSFKMSVSWVAMELASERRSEFIADDGKGRYWQQYERALQYFDDLSKANIRSTAESKIGPGANVGGKTQPTTAQLKGRPRFVFASDRKDPTGPGGF